MVKLWLLSILLIHFEIDLNIEQYRSRLNISIYFLKKNRVLSLRCALSAMTTPAAWPPTDWLRLYVRMFTHKHARAHRVRNAYTFVCEYEHANAQLQIQNNVCSKYTNYYTSNRHVCSHKHKLISVTST